MHALRLLRYQIVLAMAAAAASVAFSVLLVGVLAHPAAAQGQETTVTIVTDAAGLSQGATYEFCEQFIFDCSDFTQFDGDTQTFTVRPGASRTFDASRVKVSHISGWNLDWDCADDNGQTVDAFRKVYETGDTSSIEFWYSAGTNATCTITHTFVGTLNFTVEVRSSFAEARIGLGFREQFQVIDWMLEDAGDGASATRVINAGPQDGLFETLSPSDLGFIAEAGGCVGAPAGDFGFAKPNGPIPARSNVFTGTLVAGANVTCTIDLVEIAPVPLTISVTTGGEPVAGPVAYRPVFEGASSSVANSQVSMLTEGDILSVDAYTFQPAEIIVPGRFRGRWDMTAFLCVDQLNRSLFEEFDWTVFGLSEPPLTIYQEIPEGVTSIDCELNFTDTETEHPGLLPTVTCLAGNGRVDMNILNTTTAPASYGVTIGTLNSRVRTIAGKDWWRSPVTGRQDGEIRVVVTKAGDIVFADMFTVACDDDPYVESPQLQLINVCRGNNGFVAWQFANPTAAPRSYVIEFAGVPNRSTTADAFGAAVRAVSGRPDGVHTYRIRVGSTVLVQGQVTVACDA